MALFAAVCALAATLFLFEIGERWKRRRILAGFCAAVAIVCGLLAWRHHRLEAQLTEAAASAYGGLELQVDCHSWISTHIFHLGQPGWVEGTRDGKMDTVAQLSSDICAGLRQFISNPATRDHNARWSVHVLSHEAAHVSGVGDESAAECTAIAHDAAVAEALGATPDDAHDLAVWYQQEYWPRMPASYRRIACDPVRPPRSE